MSDDAQSLIKGYQYLWGQQANFRTLWNTIAQFVMPGWDNFVGDVSEGTVRTSRLFDSSAVSANERFAAILESLLTPRTQRWHKLTPADARLAEDPDVAAYCEQVDEILFNARYRPGANYASQADECYLSLGGFGNAAMHIDELPGKNLLYRSVPLSEIVWSLNSNGMVDTVYRRFTWTAQQIMQRWGKGASEKVRTAYEKNPYSEFDILHCVKPNMDYAEGQIGPKGKLFTSWYLQYDDRHTLESGGYRTFPYAIGRYRMLPKEHYGRSPGSVALPAIRTLNEMKKTMLRAGQKAVDPPLLLTDEGALTAPNLRAGGLTYGALGSDGVPLVQPLESKGRFDIGAEMMEAEKRTVDDSFLTSLMQILEQNPGMTATEAMIRAQEKGILITPAMGRQQSEFLGPQIVREIDILHHAGVLPPPPPQLLDSGQGLKIEYTSPMAKLMRAEESQTIMTSLQGLLQVGASKPEVLDVVDWDSTTRRFLETSGFPLSLMLSPDAVEKIRQAREQQQAESQAPEQGADLSQAALNVAQAHKALADSPQGP